MSRRVRVAATAIGIFAIGGVLATGLVGLSVVRIGPSASALGPPRFVEETATAGIDQVYEGGEDYQVGGGVSVFDCDADGRPDLYLAGNLHPAVLLRNVGSVGGPLRFERQPSPTTDLAGVNGAYPLDVDGDGHVDLAVLRTADATLLRGLGGCRFEEADARWGFRHQGYATAFSASWETAAARLPTLAIGDYLGLDKDGRPTLECDPANELYRPADGDRFGPPVTLAPGYCALSMLFSDWDRSGRRDLRVSNDRHYYDFDHGEEQLWRVAPGEEPRLYGPGDGWVQVQIEGMGIASYDLTDDGYPDVYLTSQGSNRLQALASGPARPVYQDIGLKRNVNLVRPFTGPDTALPSTAWHPEFEDVNNDGLVDLFVSKGNVGEQPDYARQDPSNLLLGQPDGTFVEAADRAGVLSMDRGRGAALTDLNLDGLLDLIEVNLGSPVRIWRNLGAAAANGGAATPMGQWLAVTVRQPGPNRDAIGGWLEFKVGDTVTRRELTVGGGHVSGQLGPIHVGLGSATAASVRVTWPDGEVGPWLTAAADTFAIVDRATGTLQTWTPPAT